MRKKVLFVINTMGRGGAEFSLIQFMRQFDPEQFDLYLYVMLGQGELIDRIPSYVTLLNDDYDSSDVLSEKGKRILYRRTAKMLLCSGAFIKGIPTMLGNIAHLRNKVRQHPEKVIWRMVANSAPVFRENFDLAVAYLEGASTYFLSDRVKAKQKIAFFHTDYMRSGYTPKLDGKAYANMDKIYCVSEEGRASFLQAYEQYRGKTEVFYNIIDRDSIMRRANMPCSFDDDGYNGIRIVTLGRLIKLKAIDKSIRTMRRLKEQGINARWYVYGEGSERVFLEREIQLYGLQDCFFLPGVADNPFPYLLKADIYVQCSEYEGRSLAISEAQLLGRPVIISNHSGNVGQVRNLVDGMLVEFTSKDIARAIIQLVENPELRSFLGKNAAEKMKHECDHHTFGRILQLMEGGKSA